MINIHCVVIGYGLADDLRKLFEAADAPNIMWRLFLHSDIPEVVETCYNLADTYKVNYYAYKTNRGLSRSWNEGISDAYMFGADVAIILNDDMLPGPGDVQRVAQAAVEHPECGLVKCMGLDLRSGQRTPMEFGLTAITKRGWDVIGAFDENIWPIYWEDVDWSRRLKLSGLPVHIVQETTAVHAGSKTSVTVPGLLEKTNGWYNANQAYYHRKWGGAIGAEAYATPFNDPALGLKIEPFYRHRPYGQYDREDVERG